MRTLAAVTLAATLSAGCSSPAPPPEPEPHPDLKLWDDEFDAKHFPDHVKERAGYLAEADKAQKRADGYWDRFWKTRVGATDARTMEAEATRFRVEARKIDKMLDEMRAVKKRQLGWQP